MNHWIVVPVVLPSLMAPLIVLAARHDLVLQRVFSLASTVVVAAVSIGLLVAAIVGPPQAYILGNWPPPFGIALVLDRLSALMLVLASILALTVAVFACYGWDSRGRHFHALFQFQLMGINGAFLTGDIFNLFVFFEVLLIASYGLMLHGGGGERLKAGVQYVVINLAGSTLFLVGVGLIYGVTGTLNMADLAVKVPQVPAESQGLLRAGALLLLAVFGIKAALVPLHFWLPRTYAAAPPPVAALFAIMTKVGAYAIIRVFSLVFGPQAGDLAGVIESWLLPAALVTLVIGMIGLLGARALLPLICYAVIGSMGTLLIAIGVFTPQALSAGLYYLVHSTVAAAALFLLADLVIERRGRHGDSLSVAPSYPQIGVLAVLYFLAAIAMVGMPPLSGFIGKLLILDGARDAALVAWIWAAVLGTGLLALIGFARAGSLLFWKPSEVAGRIESMPKSPSALPMICAGAMVGVTVLLTAFAGPVMTYMEVTAEQLFDGRDYILAVLGPDAFATAAMPQ